jgi:hypothetical protein
MIIANFLDQDYSYKSFVTQFFQDAGSAPIRDVRDRTKDICVQGSDSI